MKRLALICALGLLKIALLATAGAADEKPTDSKTASPAPPAKAESPTKSEAPNQDELEAKFKATMTHAVMNGRWCLIKEGQLQPEQEDKYTIVGVNKLFGDNWVVRARIQYGKRDVTAPIPVKVKWAGDTPVITVDGFGLPGGGSAYSARVLIYGDTYAGTWSAGDHGGLMSGLIVREKE